MLTDVTTISTMVSMRKYFSLDGKKMVAARVAAMLSHKKLAEISGISVASLSSWENSEVPKRVFLRVARSLADALGVNPSDLQAGDHFAPRMLPESQPEPNTAIVAKLAEIPTWELEVAAGDWVQISNGELSCDEHGRSIDQGLFRVRVIGDSMLPKFPSGCLVEFKIMRLDMDALKIGHQYLVCRSDSTATFKTLVKIDGDTMTLAALNKRKYPDPLIVPLQEVVRVAAFEFILSK